MQSGLFMPQTIKVQSTAIVERKKGYYVLVVTFCLYYDRKDLCQTDNDKMRIWIEMHMENTTIIVRDAKLEDAKRILEIYDYYVKNTANS